MTNFNLNNQVLAELLKNAPSINLTDKNSIAHSMPSSPTTVINTTPFAASINNGGNESNNFVNNILGIGLVLIGSYGLYRLFIWLDEENNEY
jgi:hypothetical protein